MSAENLETGIPENNTGLRRIQNALIFSVHGIRACMRTEEAFRQEVFMAALMIPAAFWLGETTVERILLIGVTFLMLIVELLNTGIERAIDRISFERHELSKESKDMGSAAVFLSVLLALLVWGLIAFDRFF